MNMLARFLGRRPALEAELDIRLAARRMARARVDRDREPVRARARQICAELGREIPPALRDRPE